MPVIAHSNARDALGQSNTSLPYCGSLVSKPFPFPALLNDGFDLGHRDIDAVAHTVGKHFAAVEPAVKGWPRDVRPGPLRQEAPRPGRCKDLRLFRRQQDRWRLLDGCAWNVHRTELVRDIHRSTSLDHRGLGASRSSASHADCHSAGGSTLSRHEAGDGRGWYVGSQSCPPAAYDLPPSADLAFEESFAL